MTPLRDHPRARDKFVWDYKVCSTYLLVCTTDPWMGPSNTNPSRLISLALTLANKDTGVLALPYQEDYLNM
ncbi:hypothetical protein EVAR_23103_1 [Eumeta japonica]|uniref:Uncharacterized protein n=1 Tax=Eumeta variegata TaxID=151549 RepID=A0A4C1VN56_EUMVA|nr:hypothetical protein EVAR_23103_1 [Eumeta japonica]